MSLKPTTEFNREVGVKLTPGQPVITGYAVAIGHDPTKPLVFVAPTKGALIDRVSEFLPTLEVDHNHIYPVAITHRTFIQTASDAEEL